jgi:hypothetical protein
MSDPQLRDHLPRRPDRDRAVGDTFYWVASSPRSQRRAQGNVVSIDEAPTVTA